MAWLVGYNCELWRQGIFSMASFSERFFLSCSLCHVAACRFSCVACVQMQVLPLPLTLFPIVSCRCACHEIIRTHFLSFYFCFRNSNGHILLPHVKYRNSYSPPLSMTRLRPQQPHTCPFSTFPLSTLPQPHGAMPSCEMSLLFPKLAFFSAFRPSRFLYISI